MRASACVLMCAGLTFFLLLKAQPYRKPHMYNYWSISLTLALVYVLLGW